MGKNWPKKIKHLTKSYPHTGLILFLMILLTGCHQGTTDSFCLIYKPVQNVAKIKPDMQRLAVKRNNLKYEELCE